MRKYLWPLVTPDVMTPTLKRRQLKRILGLHAGVPSVASVPPFPERELNKINQVGQTLKGLLQGCP